MGRGVGSSILLNNFLWCHMWGIFSRNPYEGSVCPVKEFEPGVLVEILRVGFHLIRLPFLKKISMHHQFISIYEFIGHNKFNKNKIKNKMYLFQ